MDLNLKANSKLPQPDPKRGKSNTNTNGRSFNRQEVLQDLLKMRWTASKRAKIDQFKAYGDELMFRVKRGASAKVKWK